MTEFLVRRIIIACDAVSENRAGIEAAARFASAWKALLHAVFVQDESLLQLAALPFARQVGAAGVERLDEAAILHHFEADAARTRAALERAAQRRSIAASFAVVRGHPTLATLSVGDRDLLVVSAMTRPFAGRFRMASRWLATALKAHLPVLLLRNYADWTDGVVCLMQSDAASSWRALAAAARFAIAGDHPLFVRIVDDAVSVGEVRKRLEEIAPAFARTAPIESARRASPLDEGDKSLLVVDAAPEINDLTALAALVERARGSILLVR